MALQEHTPCSFDNYVNVHVFGVHAWANAKHKIYSWQAGHERKPRKQSPLSYICLNTAIVWQFINFLLETGRHACIALR